MKDIQLLHLRGHYSDPTGEDVPRDPIGEKATVTVLGRCYSSPNEDALITTLGRTAQ